MKNQNQYEKNRQAVLKSTILAKAAIQMQGYYEIAVVFQKSTRHEFYWVFRARSPRSPRRSWQMVAYFGRDGLRYRDFGSFLEHITRTRGKILNERIFQVRKLAALLAKTEHESIHGNWTPQDPSRIKVDRVDEKIRRGRMGKLAFLRWQH